MQKEGYIVILKIGNQLTEFGVISKWEEQLGYKFQEFWSSAGLKNLNLAKMLNIDFDKNCDSGYVRLFEDDKFVLFCFK